MSIIKILSQEELDIVTCGASEKVGFDAKELDPEVLYSFFHQSSMACTLPMTVKEFDDARAKGTYKHATRDFPDDDSQWYALIP